MQILISKSSGIEAKSREVVENSPLKEKIEPLLSNPLLCEKVIRGTTTLSNCFGTASYILGIDTLVSVHWDGLDDAAFKMSGHYVLLDMNRPGYIGKMPMAHFIHDRMHETDKEASFLHLVAVSDPSAIDVGYKIQYTKLIHCAIYLGNIEGEEIIFHQYDYGGKFGFLPLKDYISRYYIPGRNLEIKFYKVNP